MAKTSNRYRKKDKQEERKIFRAGIYTRLSNERTESYRAKSYSIESQIYYCEDYAKKENIEIAEVYKDYEYSGTNFDRPAYQRMMEDVRSGKINCIIIRDLSRLGREHIEMGRLIDKVFPFLGVRFISVTDKFDTEKKMNSNKSFEVMLKNIINDMYSKDISTKIISSKHQRAKDGYFIGSVPPYGYKINKTSLGQILEPDVNTAPILKYIFDLAEEGKSQLEIEAILNDKRFSSPMVYYKTGRMKQEDGDIPWTVGTICKLLRNETYTGSLYQGKKRQNLAKGQKQRTTDETEWIVCKDSHEAIVSKEQFDKVQRVRKKNLEESYFSYPQRNLRRESENRYKGIIFYEPTGKEMYRRYRILADKSDLYYIFVNEFRKVEKGTRVIVWESEIDQVVKETISMILQKTGDRKERFERIKVSFQMEKDFLESKLSNLKQKTREINANIRRFYEQYATGITTKEEYIESRKNERRNLSFYKDEILKLSEEIDRLPITQRKAENFLTDLHRAKSKRKLTRELLLALIKRINVRDKENIEIVFTFRL